MGLLLCRRRRRDGVPVHLRAGDHIELGRIVVPSTVAIAVVVVVVRKCIVVVVIVIVVVVIHEPHEVPKLRLGDPFSFPVVILHVPPL